MDTSVDRVLGDRADRLLRFLEELQAMHSRPVRNLESYPSVCWFHQVPADDVGVATAWTSNLESGPQGLWLSVERPERTNPPEPPELVVPWVVRNSLFNSTADEPGLRAATVIPAQAQVSTADGSGGPQRPASKTTPTSRLRTPPGYPAGRNGRG